MKPTPATPLPVLFCHYTADIQGGSDRSLFDLVTHLPPTRIAAHMVLRPDDPLIAEYRAAGIPVSPVRLYPPRRGLEPLKLARFFLSYWPSVFSIWRIIRKSGAQLVHVNTINNLQGPMAARLSGRPLVWHVRELMPDSRLNGLMRGLVARWATLAVANSNAVAESLSACGPRVRTVFNGIDLSEYERLPEAPQLRRELCLPEEGPLLACVGRLEAWKGQHVLIEAMPQILATCPDVQLLVVGGPAVNKPDYLPMLKCRCAALGIADKVHFLGMRKDVPQILGAATMLILPSVTPEPFGRTLVEAMAAGKAVVATRAGGPLDIVEEGVTGLLCTPDDPDDLAAKIQSLLADPARAQALGEKGREVAWKRFALARVVEEMAALFEEVGPGQAA